jgi:HAD superfamily hydrolase (TIGR01548 family)
MPQKIPTRLKNLTPSSQTPLVPALTPFAKLNLRPSLIIFDVDGVLVDTRNSFQRTTLETVRRFSGKRVSRAEWHLWKNKPGFNDDWKLSHAWVRALGGNFTYDEVKAKFVDLYWGKNGRGYVSGERWLLSHAQLRRLQESAELAIFTGRIRRELDYTMDRWEVREYFQKIVTVESVQHPKPHPEGLLKILGARDAVSAVYLGDNVDDASAACSAGMPFLGVLPRQSQERRLRGPLLRRLGALAILGSVEELAP